MSLKNKNNINKFLITSSFVLSITIIFIFITYQSKVTQKFFYDSIYLFTKISATNVGTFLNSQPEKSSFLIPQKYEKADISVYKEYENPEVFIVTDVYIDQLIGKGACKYTSTYAISKNTKQFIDSLLNSYLSIEMVSKAIIVDKSGYIVFSSRGGEKTFRGSVTLDALQNVVKTLNSDYSHESLKSYYISDDLYQIPKTKELFTKYVIRIDDQAWGNFIVFYNSQAIKDMQQTDIRKVLFIIAVLIGFSFFMSKKILKDYSGD